MYVLIKLKDDFDGLYSSIENKGIFKVDLILF